jgi:Beta-ketoacyl synthase, N-terminal domain
MHTIAMTRAATLVPPIAPKAGANRAVRTIDDELIAAAVRPRVLRKIDRFCQIGLTLIAALGEPPEDADATGLLIGNDLGGWRYVEEQLRELIRTHRENAINPYVATAWFPAAAQGEISIAHDMLGYSKTFSAGALSAGVAIEHAVRRVLDGTLDRALAGGIEAPDAPIILRALQIEHRVSNDHPASEAGCLIELRRADTATGHDTPVAVFSRPRRNAEEALDDIAAALSSEPPTDVFLPCVARNDPRRSTVEALVQLAKARLLSTTRCLDFAAHGDFGSAGFALAIAAAAGLSPLAPPEPAPRALVLWSDFEGLFLAAAIRRAGGVL